MWFQLCMKLMQSLREVDCYLNILFFAFSDEDRLNGKKTGRSSGVAVRR
jgi:hypothetical protein